MTYTALSGGQLNSSILDVKKANSSSLFIGSEIPSNSLVALSGWRLSCEHLDLSFHRWTPSNCQGCRCPIQQPSSCSCFCRKGIKTSSAYLSSVLTLIVGRQWTITAPSRILLFQVFSAPPLSSTFTGSNSKCTFFKLSHKCTVPFFKKRALVIFYNWAVPFLVNVFLKKSNLHFSETISSWV